MFDSSARLPWRERRSTAVPELVSIVVVAYNNWPDLELAIQSALHQSHQPVEVIVVDNDSSDATPQEVPRRFGEVVRYIRQANTGDGGAYNTGMSVAGGEFIQFLDGDDLLAPNKIEKQLELMCADPEIDIVYGDVRLFQSLAGAPQWKDWDVTDYDDILSALITPDGKGIAAHSMLYRRRVLDRVGAWDQTLYVVDRDYWLRAAVAGCRFRYCPGSLCFYRRRPGQMTSNAWAMMRGFEQVWTKACQYITTEPYKSAVATQLARLQCQMAISPRSGNRREALAKLQQARATRRNAISTFESAVARILIILPGGRTLLDARLIRRIRPAVSRLRRAFSLHQ
jgi:GT2 family glycosyltransferase